MADDLIARVGESVFGLTWESDMAIAIDDPEDALRRWARGEEPPKPGLYADVAVFVAERQDDLQGSLRSWSGAGADSKEPRPVTAEAPVSRRQPLCEELGKGTDHHCASDGKPSIEITSWRPFSYGRVRV